MNDLQDKLEQLRVDAEDCMLISRLATDPAKRDLFARLAGQLHLMVAEVETVIGAKATPSRKSSGESGTKSPV
jgi:hypothetical protein